MITEPSTLATDYVLGTLCAALAWRLRSKARGANRRAMRFWAQALAATAVGSLAGGTYHGFSTVMPAQLARAIWAGTTIVVGMAACLLLSATLTAAVPRRCAGGSSSPSGRSSRYTPRGCSGTMRS